MRVLWHIIIIVHCVGRRRKKKCIRYLHEDGASSDGENYDDSSSRLGSQRSNCDSDSLHDLDLDSPQLQVRLPFDQRSSSGDTRLSFMARSPQPHTSSALSPPRSPLSPIIHDDEEEEAVVVGTPGGLHLSFPVSSASVTSVVKPEAEVIIAGSSPDPVLTS